MLVLFIVLFFNFSKENNSCFYLFRRIICRAITRCGEETQEVLLVSKNVKNLNKTTAEENKFSQSQAYMSTCMQMLLYIKPRYTHLYVITNSLLVLAISRSRKNITYH